MLQSVKIGDLLMNEPIKCYKCKNKAVISEDKKYLCADCWLKKEGIKPLHQINDSEKIYKKD